MWYAGNLLPPQPSPAPLRETATNQRNISFHRVPHHREHRGHFPSHSSRVFLFCNFYNYRKHFNETGHLLLSIITTWICCSCQMSHSRCFSHSLCLQHWLLGSCLPWSLAPLGRIGEGGTGELEADTDLTELTVLFLSKLGSPCILTPLLHHTPWFPYPVSLIYTSV